MSVDGARKINDGQRKFGMLVNPRYKVIARLAKASHCEMWHAELLDKGSNSQEVLLRTFASHGGADPDFVTVFKARCRAAIKLKHPSLATLLDFGKVKDRFYVTTEYIPGLSLREVGLQAWKSGYQLPLWYVLYLCNSCCRGLGHAHELRTRSGRHVHLTHRMLTPENIYASFDGRIRIGDLGIADIIPGASSFMPGGVDRRYAYIAPELLNGEVADPRADIYSLGVILYELLTGYLPYNAPRARDMLIAVNSRPPQPPSEYNGAIPRQLNDMILKALAVQPVQRFDSVSAFGREVASLQKQDRFMRTAEEVGLLAASLAEAKESIPAEIVHILTDFDEIYKNLTPRRQVQWSWLCAWLKKVSPKKYAWVEVDRNEFNGIPSLGNSATGSAARQRQVMVYDVVQSPAPQPPQDHPAQPAASPGDTASGGNGSDFHSADSTTFRHSESAPETIKAASAGVATATMQQNGSKAPARRRPASAKPEASQLSEKSERASIPELFNSFSERKQTQAELNRTTDRDASAFAGILKKKQKNN
ncbi:MAG: protein kinase [Chitinivibrionales bacterium]|nr:protein kinase [Chitinivibrionales bacterium]